ncbi:MAG TPA: phosphoribosylpyrophosphate synthetase [Chitinophagaceae bacterium]|nr:phosphoribosylpyrophosphate synthetase [Chitinophagaceae bacterium]
MYSYDTVTEAIAGLKQRGYIIDFNIGYDCIVCHDTPLSLMPNEFKITEVYRFEGDTDPADQAIVYAIESKHGEKGVLVNGYGVYSDQVSDELIEKLKVVHGIL